jgi:hypothetical protein
MNPSTLTSHRTPVLGRKSASATAATPPDQPAPAMARRTAAGWTRLLLLLAAALPLVSAQAQVTPFVLQSTTGLPTNSTPRPGGASWADYDNDGRLDLLLGNGNNGYSLFHNDGNGAFSRIPLPALPSGGSTTTCSASWVDIDNDGYLDLCFNGLLLHNERGAVPAFMPLPSPTLDPSAGQSQATGAGGEALVWTDFDHDGLPDFFYAAKPSGGGTALQLWRNLGNGTFTQVTSAVLPVGAGSFMSVVCADMDNDGWEDLLVSYAPANGGYVIELWHNNGGATYQPLFTKIEPAVINIVGGVYGLQFTVFDFDNDGFLDVLYTCDNNLTLARNLGGNAFQTILTDQSGYWGLFSVAADFDNDGRSDFISDGTSGGGEGDYTNSFFHNTGGGQFTAAALGPSHSRMQLAAGDWNHDGRLDFFVESVSTNQLFRNITDISNTPPAAPTGLSAVPGTNAVRLSWTPATDAQAPSAGLSYALRLGTAPGTADLVNPAASLATGWRRLPQRGPIQTPFYVFTNLPPGFYYWSVQAIDGGLAGSPFATEGSFQIPGPALRPAYACNVTSNSAVLRSSASPGGAPAFGYFEWGLTIECENQTPPQSLGAGSSLVPVQAVLSGLQPNTLYYFRAVTTNANFAFASARNSFYTDPTVLLGDVNGDGVMDVNETGTTLSAYFASAVVWLTNGVPPANGLVQLGIGNLPTWPFHVQASSDLVTWSNLPPDGQTLFTFPDPASTNSPHRYYRLR